ncbi:hypothetical protein GCM10018781_02700 [Kitasatospora indigofera]|uniref:Uncharacterized protein n=1 Tax=Kitasatospora indigofera TaxID=67307 RepID=A0A919FB35_9ACTN|nr:hypothetical protein [Kitasatospora indigofera]GHH59466.1 hypothetical protein GCM10018781_02700 [Kitasatospora indigofera]
MPAESPDSPDSREQTRRGEGRRASPAIWGHRFGIEVVALLTVFAVLTFLLVPEPFRFLPLPGAGLVIGRRAKDRPRE